MPLVDIELIEGVFDDDQKQRMIRDVTEAMVNIQGEAMRGMTWVRVQEIASGEWAIGGKPMMLTAAAFSTATAIMAIAALGFVHVGMRTPTPELGLMMVELLPYWREAPLALLSPVIATFALLLGLTLLAGSRET